MMHRLIPNTPWNPQNQNSSPQERKITTPHHPCLLHHISLTHLGQTAPIFRNDPQQHQALTSLSVKRKISYCPQESLSLPKHQWAQPLQEQPEQETTLAMSTNPTCTHGIPLNTLS